jgi:hypothetical protein
MLWYGKSAIPSPDKILNRNSHRYLKSDQKKLFTQKKFNPSPLVDIYFYFPCDWKVNLLTNPRPLDSFKIVYASSTLYYFKVILPSQTLSLYYSISTGNLSLRAKLPSPLLTLYFSTLWNLFSLFTRVWFRKLKIRGKGYYIYKTTRNTVTHQFGHSHRIYIYLFNVSIKFLSKTHIFIYGTSKKDVFKAGEDIRSSKPLNIFTSRGVRFSRQIVYKKTGKVSSYR